MSHDRQKPTPDVPARLRSPDSSEVTALAVELDQLARNAPDKLAERVRNLTLRQQAELALRLPAKLRLELMLHAPKPMRLVRSLPDSELYLTVREVGPTDALPLVALASAAQIQHLLDLESWRCDRFDAKRSGAWVALLLEAGEPTIRRFLRSADDETLSLLFQRWVRTVPVEFELGGPDLHSVNQPETGDERGQVSPDGAYRFSPVIPEHAPAVRRLAQMLFQDQPARYQRVLWSAVYELPADLEEQALQWRQSRLEEHGFPEWTEALSIFAPPEGLRSHPDPLEPSDPDGLAAPRAPLRVLPSHDPLAEALDRLEGAQRERTFHEMISVANRLLVAERADTGDPEIHRAALTTVGGYVNVAIEARGITEPAALQSLLTAVPVIELFREGYSKAADLQRRLLRIVREGWAARHSRSLDLLDPPLHDRVSALLETRPRYAQIGEDGLATTRGFHSLREVDESAVAVNLTALLGRVFVEQMGADIEQAVEREPWPARFSTLLLTAVAWSAVRSTLSVAPLPEEVASDFLRTVSSRRTAAPDAPERALESFVQSCRRAYEIEAAEAAALLSFGRAGLEQLSAQCSNLEPGVPVDPARVTCLLLEPRR